MTRYYFIPLSGEYVRVPIKGIRHLLCKDGRIIKLENWLMIDPALMTEVTKADWLAACHENV